MKRVLLIVITLACFAILFSVVAKASNFFIQDNYETVYEEVCTGGGNAVEGAIIGGIIGHILGGNNESTAVGATLGAAIAENDGKNCQKIKKEVYVNSTITFIYDNKVYKLDFVK